MINETGLHKMDLYMHGELFLIIQMRKHFCINSIPSFLLHVSIAKSQSQTESKCYEGNVILTI